MTAHPSARRWTDQAMLSAAPICSIAYHPRKIGTPPYSVTPMQQRKLAICDLVLKCRGGAAVHVASSKIMEASHSVVLREIVEKAVSERRPGADQSELGVPDDDSEAWRVCWGLISTVDLPPIHRATFIAVLQLAHKYQLDGVLFKCQDILICDMLSERCNDSSYHSMPNLHQSSSLFSYKYPLDICNGGHSIEECLQFLGLLSDVGLTTAYKMAFSYFVTNHRQELVEYLKKRVVEQGSVADSQQLCRDLTSWLLSLVDNHT